jgi:hypothetical protein
VGLALKALHVFSIPQRYVNNNRKNNSEFGKEEKGRGKVRAAN